MVQIDMQMPKTCGECKFIQDSYDPGIFNKECIITYDPVIEKRKSKTCPLIEVKGERV